MKSLLDLIKSLYGSKAIASTIGSKTNVIRLPSGKLQRYLSKDLNIEAASDAAAQNAYNEMKELIPEVAKMNDAERLVFEGNLRRLKNKLEVSGLIEGENVPSGIVAIQSKIDELKQAGKELEKVTGEKATLTDVLKDIGASQQSMSRLNDEGLVRAAARQILINDIKAGKIKNITVSEAINMGEPLDPFRQIYGEGALEQLDSLIPNLRGLKTEMEAEKLARSKFKFEPDEARLKGSVSIEDAKKAEQEFGINKPAKVTDFKAEATKRTSIDDLIDEYNANQDRLLLTDDEGATLITYPEYNRLRDRNEEIAKALEAKGISSKVEETPKAEIIQFRKRPTEPEGKANSGRIGYETGGDVSENESLIEKILEGKIKIGVGFGDKNKDDPFNKYGFGEKDIKDPRLGIEYNMDPGNERSSIIGFSVGPKGGGISFMKPFSEKLNEEKNEDVIQTYIDFARNVWGVEVTEQEARKALGIYDMPNTSIRNELPPEEIEGKANGGRIGYAKGGLTGLDYLLGL
jgi:antitoxin component HigA of HigAB toxin-antitoxin module